MHNRALFAAIIALLLAACRPQPTSHRVIYACDGTAPQVVVKYTDAGGLIVHLGGVSLPWTQTIVIPTRQLNVRLRVANATGQGDYACTVDVDGSVSSGEGGPLDALEFIVTINNGQTVSSVQGTSFQAVPAASDQPTITVTAAPATLTVNGAPPTDGPTPAAPTALTSWPIVPPTAGASDVTPSATPPSTPRVGVGSAEWEGITFVFPYSLMSEWEAATLPSDPPASGLENWLVATHYKFTFPDYLIANEYQPARILIFPVAAWQNYNPEAEKRIPALQKLLADKPTTFGPNEEIPVLPVFNSGQIFRTHVAYLTFQNGSGVRFVTQYDQAPMPVNNKELFYTFQGLTADGTYYVSTFFPINHPSLPADESNPAVEVGSDFVAYRDKTVKALDAAGDHSFNPDLATLDQIMQSLKVK